MVKYSNGKIYKIIGSMTDKIYVGKTTQKYLASRMAEHRRHYKYWVAGKKAYYTAVEILKYDDAQIILLETVNVKSKDKLAAQERHWVESSPNCVNKNLPGRSKIETAKIVLARATQYYKDNKEAIKLQRISKVRCECGALVVKCNSSSQHIKTNKHKNSYMITRENKIVNFFKQN